MAPDSVCSEVQVFTHVIPCAHVREYPDSLLDETAQPVLQVKQYVPAGGQLRRRGDPVVICAGGIGMAKECYAPLFADVQRHLTETHGITVSSFWIADTQYTGSSAVLNRAVNGNQPAWFDHARDLFHIVNSLRAYFQPPIIGLGHSMGASQLCHLAVMHPALFHSMILIEPSIYANPSRTLPLTQAQQLALRPQKYGSMAEARQKLTGAFKRWDERALELHFQHGFWRPSEMSDEVVTCTPRDAELALVARPNPTKIGVDRSLNNRADRLANPDIDTESHWLYPYYSPSARLVYNSLPHVRPRTLFIDGGAAHAADPSGFAKARVERCGTGVGGSGGMQEGQVAHEIIDGAGHAMVVETDALPRLSKIVADRIATDVGLWRQEDEDRRKRREGKTRNELQRFDPGIREIFTKWDGVEFLQGEERERAIAAKKKREEARRKRQSSNSRL